MGRMNAEISTPKAPSVNITRTKRPFSKCHTTTGNTGFLYPFYANDTAQPGDTWKLAKLGAQIRTLTPLFPVMDDAWADINFFFVPYRLISDDFLDKFSGGWTPSAWEDPEEWITPKIYIPQSQEVSANVPGGIPTSYTQYGVRKGDLLDHFGIPTESRLKEINPITVENQRHSTRLNRLKLNAYYLVVNEYFLNQNTDDPYLIDKSNTDKEYVVNTDRDKYYGTPTKDNVGSAPFRVARMHDLFSDALPAPQKGPSVMIPGLDGIDYGGIAYIGSPMSKDDMDHIYSDFDGGAVNLVSNAHLGTLQIDQQGTDGDLLADDNTGIEGPNINQIAGTTLFSAGATIYNFYEAVMMQHYEELLGLYGSRYTEYVYGMFGVSSMDKSPYRPEYLGGCRVMLNTQQVIQQSSTDTNSPLGNVGAYSNTIKRMDSVFTKSFTEHGIIIGVFCVRTNHFYSQGIAKSWRRNDQYDYYNPVFSALGNQPIMKSEINATHNGNGITDSVFGYQEAWYDYSYDEMDELTGEMRPYLDNSYAGYTYGDEYATDEDVTLSPEWMAESPNNMDRTLAVASRTSDQFVAQFRTIFDVVRPMPLQSLPGMKGIR